MTELPGYYECFRCFAIRHASKSRVCPGCGERNCLDCRCGSKHEPACPSTLLDSGEYEVAESQVPFQIEEDLLLGLHDIERIE